MCQRTRHHLPFLVLLWWLHGSRFQKWETSCSSPNRLSAEGSLKKNWLSVCTAAFEVELFSCVVHMEGLLLQPSSAGARPQRDAEMKASWITKWNERTWMAGDGGRGRDRPGVRLNEKNGTSRTKWDNRRGITTCALMWNHFKWCAMLELIFWDKKSWIQQPKAEKGRKGAKRYISQHTSIQESPTYWTG